MSLVDPTVHLQCAIRSCHACNGILHNMRCMSDGRATSQVTSMSNHLLHLQLTLAQGLEAQRSSELEAWTVERSAHQSQLGRLLLH